MHGIIVLMDYVVTTLPVAQNNETKTNVGATLAVAQNVVMSEARAGLNPAPTNESKKTIGDIVGAYKSLVANKCLGIFKTKKETMGKLWQRNYYEHIIRNDESFLKIADYIICNPRNWREDQFYVE